MERVMASLYRRQSRPGYTVSWRVGGRVRTKNVRSKRNALALRDKMQQLEESIRLGIGDRDADRHALADAEPIAKHVEAFRKNLAHRGCTANHARETASLITRIFALACVERISDITPARIAAGVDEFRNTP